jgi:hypothetical protein
MYMNETNRGEGEPTDKTEEYLDNFQKRFERRLRDPKFALECLGFVVLCVYAIFTVRMYYANRDSADAATQSANTASRQLEMADRPWVTIDIMIASPLTYEKDRVTMTFDFIPKNIGHSPAQNVLIVPELLPVFMGDDLRDMQKRICDSANQVTGAFPRYVIFPERNRRRSPSGWI